jgi:hypothetical protein
MTDKALMAVFQSAIAVIAGMALAAPAGWMPGPALVNHFYQVAQKLKDSRNSNHHNEEAGKATEPPVSVRSPHGANGAKKNVQHYEE